MTSQHLSDSTARRGRLPVRILVLAALGITLVAFTEVVPVTGGLGDSPQAPLPVPAEEGSLEEPDPTVMPPDTELAPAPLEGQRVLPPESEGRWSSDPEGEESVDRFLAKQLGERWSGIRSQLGPVRLASILKTDVSALPAWSTVEGDVYLAGQEWIDARRGTWPGGLSDRWRDVERLDFQREAFNPRGRRIDRDLDRRLRGIVLEHNDRIDELARDFWDAIALAYEATWSTDAVAPLPDPAGDGRVLAHLELMAAPGELPGMLLQVVASEQGWRVELPLTLEDAPAAAMLLDMIHELEHQRLAQVRAEIEG